MMKSKFLGLALFLLTAAAVVFYPQLDAKNVHVDPVIDPPIEASIVAEGRLEPGAHGERSPYHSGPRAASSTLRSTPSWPSTGALA